MYTVAFETLGCRLNQAETAILQNRFLARGYTLAPTPETADLFVLHTCTLTADATAKCRRRLRTVIRRNPDACVAAIGCYAQTDAEELARIDGVDFVVGTAEKLRLHEIIPAPVKLTEAMVLNAAAASRTFTVDGVGHYPSHTRANLKVQDGCDFACAFCLIPRSRGRARSRDLGDLLREARTLANHGYKEIVITGVNVGTYRDGKRTLADVVKALTDIDGLERVRLSSIEPTTIEEELLDEMARGSKLCRYLHVPLQSGDSEVLARMRRRYDAAEYERFMRGALDRVPNLGLGTDVIVGFPGESEAAFERTCQLVASLPFVNTHVFAFSARPRTSAYTMKDHISRAEVRRRHDRLHSVALAKKHAIYSAQAGRALRVLFERPSEDGCYYGYTDSYLRVKVSSRSNLHNRIVDVTAAGTHRAENAAHLAIVAHYKEGS